MRAAAGLTLVAVVVAAGCGGAGAARTGGARTQTERWAAGGGVREARADADSLLHFKRGVGLGAHNTLCTDLDAASGGLGNASWWYDWGHSKEAFTGCDRGEPVGGAREYVPQIWGTSMFKTPKRWEQVRPPVARARECLVDRGAEKPLGLRVSADVSP